MRAEFDARYHSLRTISASGSYSWANVFQFASSWSKRGFIPQLTGFNDPNLLDQAINAQTTVHTVNNRLGGDLLVQLRHPAQEYSAAASVGVLQRAVLRHRVRVSDGQLGFAQQLTDHSDHRFFMSFTLAGLGNFSPFNGALGGVPR